jgi:opacity protein-like surface antigen
MVKASATGMGQPPALDPCGAGGNSSALTRFASRLGIYRIWRVPLPNRTTALVLASLLFVTVASSAPNDSDDTGEFALLTGAAFGGLGTHPSVSGSAGVAITRFAMVLVDAGAIPVGNATLLPTGPLIISGSTLFNFGVTLQARIPVNRWEPYVLLEPALLVNSYLAGDPAGSAAIHYQGNRHSKFGLEGGAGTRYYVKRNWGVRAEFRYVSSAKNFSEIQAGVFYQVEGYSEFHFRRNIRRLLAHLSDGNQDLGLRQTSAH